MSRTSYSITAMGCGKAGFGKIFLGLAMLGFSGCASSQLRARRPLYVPPLAKAIVRTAKTYLPEEEKNIRIPRDCSDFVRKVFSINGIQLPRTSTDMSLLGRRITSGSLRMGDLVFFSGSRANRIVGHVGIYVGNGIFIHLSKPNIGVSEESLYSDYYRRRFLIARRIISP